MSKVIIQQSFSGKTKCVLVGTVPFIELKNRVRLSYRTEESRGNYQRQIDAERVKSIAKYLVRSISINEKGGTSIGFPTSIILACPNDSIVHNHLSDEAFCEFVVPDDTMIVDGQHRYSGVLYLYEEAKRSPSVFGYSSETILKYLEKFSFGCAILLNFDMWEQAQVFADVNFNQKKVNKSLFYDIYGVAVPLDDSSIIPRQNEIFLAHELVVFLEKNENSAFQGFVKMLGKGSGYVSQAFLVEALMKHLSPRGIWSDAVTMLKEGNKNYNYIANELLCYIAAVRFTFKELWPDTVEDKPSSVLFKTTGVGAIIALLKDAHIALPNTHVKQLKESATTPYVSAFTISYFTNYLKPLRPFGNQLFELSGEFGRSGGAGMQSGLYNRMKDIIEGRWP